MKRNNEERFLLEIFHIVEFAKQITRYFFLEVKESEIIVKNCEAILLD